MFRVLRGHYDEPQVPIVRGSSYFIPFGASHIGVKCGNLRFVLIRDEAKSSGTENGKKSNTGWRYWLIPLGANKCRFSDFSIEGDSWHYGSPEFI